MSDTKGQVENLLKDLGQKIDSLIEEGKNATGGLREELDEKVEILKQKRDELDENFSEYREKGKEKWEDAKPHLNSAIDELKAAADKFFNKKS